MIFFGQFSEFYYYIEPFLAKLTLITNLYYLTKTNFLQHEK